MANFYLNTLKLGKLFMLIIIWEVVVAIVYCAMKRLIKNIIKSRAILWFKAKCLLNRS
jgi:hypothetical protein